MNSQPRILGQIYRTRCVFPTVWYAVNPIRKWLATPMTFMALLNQVGLSCWANDYCSLQGSFLGKTIDDWPSRSWHESFLLVQRELVNKEGASRSVLVCFFCVLLPRHVMSSWVFTMKFWWAVKTNDNNFLFWGALESSSSVFWYFSLEDPFICKLFFSFLPSLLVFSLLAKLHCWNLQYNYKQWLWKYTFS